MEMPKVVQGTPAPLRNDWIPINAEQRVQSSLVGHLKAMATRLYKVPEKTLPQISGDVLWLQSTNVRPGGSKHRGQYKF